MTPPEAESPLDDILSTAEACADLILESEFRFLYLKVEADLVEASSGWPGTDARRKMILRAYLARFRERLGIENPPRYA